MYGYSTYMPLEEITFINGLRINLRTESSKREDYVGIDNWKATKGLLPRDPSEEKFYGAVRSMLDPENLFSPRWELGGRKMINELGNAQFPNVVRSEYFGNYYPRFAIGSMEGKPVAIGTRLSFDYYFQFYIDIHSPPNTANLVVSKVKEHVFPMLSSYKPIP
mgnify:CR=1 FL=1